MHFTGLIAHVLLAFLGIATLGQARVFKIQVPGQIKSDSKFNITFLTEGYISHTQQWFTLIGASAAGKVDLGKTGLGQVIARQDLAAIHRDQTDWGNFTLEVRAPRLKANSQPTEYVISAAVVETVGVALNVATVRYNASTTLAP